MKKKFPGLRYNIKSHLSQIQYSHRYIIFKAFWWLKRNRPRLSTTTILIKVSWPWIVFKLDSLIIKLPYIVSTTNQAFSFKIDEEIESHQSIFFLQFLSIYFISSFVHIFVVLTHSLLPQDQPTNQTSCF